MTTPLIQFKTALVTSIEAELGANVAVSRRPPVSPLDLYGDDGTGEAVWLAEASADSEVPHLGLPLELDEDGELTVIAQVLGDDDTDVEVETRAVALFAGIVEPLMADPSLGLGVDLFEVLRLSWTFTSGAMPNVTERYGARFEITLAFRSRLSIGA